MASVSFGTFSKRRNSTKQPTTELSDNRTVTLKETTSQDRPTFIVTGNNFNYNYCSWDGKYYFIEDIESLRNNEIAVHCVLDPLATYKTEIINSTQFVSYSSLQSSIWLPDTRIPLQKNANVSQSVSTMNFLFTAGGFYVLAAVGEGGCEVYVTDITNLSAMIQDLSQWTSDLETAIFGALPFPTPNDETEATANLYSVMMKTGVIGNAYIDAPSCIRSCIWVPFFIADFADGGGTTIKLGAYDTGATAYRCKTSPVTNTVTVSIPWHYSDWRRATCEEVYLYLPLVGLVNVPSDEIINETSITVEWSATATDGCIAYRITAGNQVIGSYGASCAVNYPIGISQQASAGEIVQTAFQGAQKTISSGLSAASSLNPVGMIGGIAEAGLSAVDTVYQTINTAMTRHNSCIGGIGGGAGVGLSLDLKCFTVSHPTVVNPSDMVATMGYPTMKPVTLSTLSGYCQCANAHVAAPATASELNAIDAMLNGGFYIE